MNVLPFDVNQTEFLSNIIASEFNISRAHPISPLIKREHFAKFLRCRLSLLIIFFRLSLYVSEDISDHISFKIPCYGSKLPFMIRKHDRCIESLAKFITNLCGCTMRRIFIDQSDRHALYYR